MAQKNLDAVSALARAADLPCTLLIAPRSMDVMGSRLPSLYEPNDAVFDLLEESDISYTLPLDALRSAAEKGAYVWYRTDHHWTVHGAYLAYVSVAEALGITPYPLSFFQAATISEDFLGTSHSKVGMIPTPPDTVTLYRYEGDENFLLTDGETGEIRRGFYEWNALERKNQYEIFLGGNVSRLSVTAPGQENRPRLLLIKDSFACALTPFLALHFDLELIDPRYDKGSLPALLEEEHFDRILVVQGLYTLATDESLAGMIG